MPVEGPSSVSRAQRLLDLIQVLRRHRFPVSGAAPAQELGLSLRTLYRDIETLKAQGIPFMITAAMKSVLSALGHSRAEIAKMTPAQAHEIIEQAIPLGRNGRARSHAMATAPSACLLGKRGVLDPEVRQLWRGREAWFGLGGWTGVLPPAHGRTVLVHVECRGAYEDAVYAASRATWFCAP
jgi:hypothetical protein